MKSNLFIVELPDTTKRVVFENEIKDECIFVQKYDYDDDDSYSYRVKIPIKKLEKFFILINTSFIMGKDKSPKSAPTVGFGISHFAYIYSIIIVNNDYDYKFYEREPVFSKSGIATTKFDRYSYHTIENDITIYNEDLSYEVLNNINFDEILL